MRNKIKWNEEWEFYKGNLPEAEAVWERVALPHTWNATDGQDGGSDYYLMWSVSERMRFS